MDSQFCWPFPNRRQTEAENEGNFTIFSLSPGVASLRPIHSYKTACSTLEFAACALPGKKMQSRVSGKIRNTLSIASAPTSKSDRAATERQKPIEKTLKERKQKCKGLQKRARQLKKHKAKPAF